MAADSTATIESTANLDPPKPSGSLLRLKAPSISFSCLFRARIGRPTVSNISPSSRVCALAPDQTRKRAMAAIGTQRHSPRNHRPGPLLGVESGVGKNCSVQRSWAIQQPSQRLLSGPKSFSHNQDPKLPWGHPLTDRSDDVKKNCYSVFL